MSSDPPPSESNPDTSNPAELANSTPAEKRPIKIGSQRKQAGEETPASPEKASQKVSSVGPSDKPAPVPTEELESYFPTPEIKQMTPDLEDEIAQALGGKSLEDLMDEETGATRTPVLEPESRLSANVIKIHREDVFFSLGGRDEGVVPLKHFSEAPEIGSSVEVIVVSLNQLEGLYTLTIPGAAIDVGDWSDLSEGMVVEVLVTGHNKGGLECEVNHLRGFMPASQISTFRVEDFEQFVGQKLQCVVTEANPERRNLVVSQRAVLEREQESSRKKLLEELEVGQMREGVVARLQDFGAFVNLGGVDGLIHISKMSWDRVNHPSEVLTEGQTIQVKIDKIDSTTGKIGLSYRDTTTNPWDEVETKFSVGSIVTGTVTRGAAFGAFVRLAPGIEGLIHISELAHHRVHKVDSVVEQGQEVEVKVLSVDRSSQRIGLSLKALANPLSSSSAADEEDDEDAQPSAVPKFQGELKGGTNRSSGGEQFGLDW
jgi:small subunit ribosomal protein S1